jgi:hypothetical protein
MLYRIRARGDDVVRRFAVAGVAVGALLAACGEVDSEARRAIPPRDVVAVVNGQPITRGAFERFIESAAGGEIASADGEARRRLLLRMVDEELLLQRAIELGLHRRDPAARRAILSAVIASVTSEGEVGEPDEANLRERREQVLRDTLDALRREADVRILDRDLVAASAPEPSGGVH